MGKKPLTTEPPVRAEPVEPEKVTAPVTPPTEDPWAHLEIPEFLRRTDPVVAPGPTHAHAPIANTSGGAKSGTGQVSTHGVMAGATGNFEQFRVDPEEIESKIRHEADRRWRAWVPTKEHLSRPRKSYYLKQVRKEFYP